jgi:hypothetical protein
MDYKQLRTNQDAVRITATSDGQGGYPEDLKSNGGSPTFNARPNRHRQNKDLLFIWGDWRDPFDSEGLFIRNRGCCSSKRAETFTKLAWTLSLKASRRKIRQHTALTMKIKSRNSLRVADLDLNFLLSQIR